MFTKLYASKCVNMYLCQLAQHHSGRLVHIGTEDPNAV